MAGNAMIGLDGKTWIIDPATYYGHPEADIAMTKLFGGFASAFYETYFACADLTLTPGYQRKALCTKSFENLLITADFFGEVHNYPSNP